MALTVLVSLGLGAIIIAAGGLMMYMSSLVKNAYALKVEMQAEMNEQLQRIADDADKKTKWIKRDLVEEIDKSRHALIADNQRRFGEFEAMVNKRLGEFEDAFRRDRLDTLKQIETLKLALAQLEQKARTLHREQRRMQYAPQQQPIDLAALEAADADAEGEPAAEAAAEAPTEPPPEAPPPPQ